ncbi:MAG: hypothetical protein H6732_11755 [Alphaproteobacteria bacterium]|nr:hypothetical protein [Alphaproteobacteria bacterium]
MPGIALLLALLGAPAALPGWTRHALPSELSVELPAAAERRHTERGVVVGRVVSDTVVSTWEDGWAAATITHVPRIALGLAGRAGVERRARDEILADHDATAESWTEVRRAGLEGRALTFSTRGAQGQPQRGRAEIFTWEDKVLTVTAVVDLAAPEVDRVFGSLRRGEASRAPSDPR